MPAPTSAPSATSSGRFPGLKLVIVESGGDNLTAVFSRELADRVHLRHRRGRGRQDTPQGRAGHLQQRPAGHQQDDLAPHVGADLDVMRRDSLRMRGERPFMLISLRQNEGVEEVVKWVREQFASRRRPPDTAGVPRARSRPTDPAGRVGGARIELLRIHAKRRGWAPATSRSRSGSCRRSPSTASGVAALPDQPDRRPSGRQRPRRFESTAKSGTNAPWSTGSPRHAQVHRAGPLSPPSSGPSVVEDDACVVVLPGPTIPYRGCRYFRRGRVELAPRPADLGRPLAARPVRRGANCRSRSVFERPSCRTSRCRRGGQLIYRDRFRWDGPWNDADAHWYWGGAGVREPVRRRTAAESGFRPR